MKRGARVSYARRPVPEEVGESAKRVEVHQRNRMESAIAAHELRKRGFIQRERKEKENCASCASVTSWTTRRRELCRARTSKKSFHAGRDCGYFLRKTNSRKLLRIEVDA